MRNKATHISQVPPDKGHYIAGFVDGEGSFYISARKRRDYPSGWKFGAHLKVSNRDTAILEICKRHLGCGAIRESRKGFYTLEVQGREAVRQFVVPFFSRFGFLSNKKKAEFRVFKESLSLLEQGVRSEAKLVKLLSLRDKLNEFRTTRITNTNATILGSFVFMTESSET